jgi:hypothetical protein
MNTDMERSQDYADALAAEVTELEVALQDAYQYEYEGRPNVPVFDGEQWTDPMDLLGYYFNALALDVRDVTVRSWGSGESTRKYVEVLRTYGGPNAYVRFYGDGRVEVSVFWGSDEAVSRVHAPTLDAQVWEHADAYAAVEA